MGDEFPMNHAQQRHKRVIDAPRTIVRLTGVSRVMSSTSCRGAPPERGVESRPQRRNSATGTRHVDWYTLDSLPGSRRLGYPYPQTYEGEWTSGTQCAEVEGRRRGCGNPSTGSPTRRGACSRPWGSACCWRRRRARGDWISSWPSASLV